MVDALSAVLTRWEGDDAVRAVVLSGAGERGLCAGGDVVAVYHSARKDGVEARQVLARRVSAQRPDRPVRQAVRVVDGRHRDGRRRRRQCTRKHPGGDRHLEGGDARGRHRLHPRRRRGVSAVPGTRRAGSARRADRRAVFRSRRHRNGIRRPLRAAQRTRRVHRSDRRRRRRERTGRPCRRTSAQ